MDNGSAQKGAAVTRRLLGCGVIAGPIYIVTGAAEMATREGFDPLRHPLSLMSNGAFGWVHIVMLIATGLLTCAAAVGFRRSQGAMVCTGLAPLLLGVYGLGLVGAGIFSADPALGFPVGTPAEANAVSWHGLLHFTSSGIGFLGLVGACFSSARAYSRGGYKGWAVFSALTGLIFLAAFAGIGVGQGSPMTIITFSLAVILAWCWISAVSGRTLRLHSASSRGRSCRRTTQGEIAEMAHD